MREKITHHNKLRRLLSAKIRGEYCREHMEIFREKRRAVVQINFDIIDKIADNLRGINR